MVHLLRSTWLFPCCKFTLCTVLLGWWWLWRHCQGKRACKEGRQDVKGEDRTMWVPICLFPLNCCSQPDGGSLKTQSKECLARLWKENKEDPQETPQLRRVTRFQATVTTAWGGGRLRSGRVSGAGFFSLPPPSPRLQDTWLRVSWTGYVPSDFSLNSLLHNHSETVSVYLSQLFISPSKWSLQLTNMSPPLSNCKLYWRELFAPRALISKSVPHLEF